MSDLSHYLCSIVLVSATLFAAILHIIRIVFADRVISQRYELQVYRFTYLHVGQLVYTRLGWNDRATQSSILDQLKSLFILFI